MTTPARIYAFEVTATFGNRAAGHIGFARTKAEAHTVGKGQRMSYRIKRVSVRADFFAVRS